MITRAAAEQVFLKAKRQTRDFELFRNAPDASPTAKAEPQLARKVTLSFDDFVDSLKSQSEKLNWLATELLNRILLEDEEHVFLRFLVPTLWELAIDGTKDRVLRGLILSQLLKHPDLLAPGQPEKVSGMLCELARDQSLEPMARNFWYRRLCEHEKEAAERHLTRAEASYRDWDTLHVDAAYLDLLARKYGVGREQERGGTARAES